MRLRDILDHPSMYLLFNVLINADGRRKTLIRDYIRPKEGDVVVDLGCGTAEIRNYLPEAITYFGFDYNPDYIEYCRKAYAGRGTFNLMGVGALEALPAKADIVLLLGVLHHLSDDEVRHTAQLVSQALAPGGRLITLDGLYFDGQGKIEKWLMDIDRGQYVRREEEYRALLQPYLPNLKAHVVPNMLCIPYTHLIYECGN